MHRERCDTKGGGPYDYLRYVVDISKELYSELIAVGHSILKGSGALAARPGSPKLF